MDKTLLRYKYSILGDSNTGKTSICIRYVNKKFEQIFQSTIGCSFMGKILEYKGKKYNLDIWDTAGQERYRSILPMYYRNADVVFICIDMSNPKSYETIDYWNKEHKKHGDNINNETIIVGTKSDLVTDEEAIQLRKKIENYYPYNAYFETSAKEDIGINELFIYSLEKCLEKAAIKEVQNYQQIITLDESQQSSSWYYTLCNIL